MYYSDDDNDYGRSAARLSQHTTCRRPRTTRTTRRCRPTRSLRRRRNCLGLGCAVGLGEGDTMRLGIFCVTIRELGCKIIKYMIIYITLQIWKIQ